MKESDKPYPIYAIKQPFGQIKIIGPVEEILADEEAFYNNKFAEFNFPSISHLSKDDLQEISAYTGHQHDFEPVMWIKDYPGYWVFQGFLFEIPVWIDGYTKQLPNNKLLQAALSKVICQVIIDHKLNGYTVCLKNGKAFVEKDKNEAE